MTIQAGSGLIAGYSYQSAEHVQGISIGITEIDTCQELLIRYWQLPDDTRPFELTISNHTVHAAGVREIQECVIATGLCANRDVAFDLTWTIDNPAFLRIVDTNKDGGCLSNQKGAYTDAVLSGTVDGEPVGSWAPTYAYFGRDVTAGLCLTPR